MPTRPDRRRIPNIGFAANLCVGSASSRQSPSREGPFRAEISNDPRSGLRSRNSVRRRREQTPDTSQGRVHAEAPRQEPEGQGLQVPPHPRREQDPPSGEALWAGAGVSAIGGVSAVAKGRLCLTLSAVLCLQDVRNTPDRRPENTPQTPQNTPGSLCSDTESFADLDQHLANVGPKSGGPWPQL